MNNSYLQYLKDYDVIQMLNEYVIISKNKFNIKYHVERYKNKDNIIYNYNVLIINKINNIFNKISTMREKNINVSFLQPIYPFYYSYSKNLFMVKHAIKIYEKILFI